MRRTQSLPKRLYHLIRYQTPNPAGIVQPHRKEESRMMKFFICVITALITLLLLWITPLNAGQPISFEYGGGAEFADSTKAVSYLSIGYNFALNAEGQSKATVGIGYKHRALTPNNLDRVFVFGLYRAEVFGQPFYLKGLIGYNSEPLEDEWSVSFEPLIGTTVRLSNNLCQFTEAGVVLQDNVFADVVTFQSAVNDAQIRTGLTLTPGGK